MPLKLNGKPFDLRPLAPSIQKLLAYLDKSPQDEIFTAPELCTRAGVASDYLSQSDRLKAFDGYTATVGRQRYMGHPKAIQELQKQLESA